MLGSASPDLHTSLPLRDMGTELYRGINEVKRDLAELPDHMFQREERFSTYHELSAMDMRAVKEPALQRWASLAYGHMFTICWYLCRREVQRLPVTYGNMPVKAGHTQCAGATCDKIYR